MLISGRLSSESPFWPGVRLAEPVAVVSPPTPSDVEAQPSAGSEASPDGAKKRPAAAWRKLPAADGVMKRPAKRAASPVADGSPGAAVLKKPAGTLKKPAGTHASAAAKPPPHADFKPTKKLRPLQYYSLFMRGTAPSAAAPAQFKALGAAERDQIRKWTAQLNATLD